MYLHIHPALQIDIHLFSSTCRSLIEDSHSSLKNLHFSMEESSPPGRSLTGCLCLEMVLTYRAPESEQTARTDPDSGPLYVSATTGGLQQRIAGNYTRDPLSL